jgi:hypothetical protein
VTLLRVKVSFFRAFWIDVVPPLTKFDHEPYP